MRRLLILTVFAIFTAVVCTTSCVHKPQSLVVAPNGGFPDSIGNIFLAKCTNSGCHNQASYTNAGGLLLDTWQHMLQGSVSGAVVVAYNTQLSPLLYYCNAYDSSDILANDAGHLTTPLTLSQYMTLKRWVAAGAPDRNGNIPFATNPDTRQKIYLTISGCNLIAVIDAQSHVIMRYIKVGTYPGNEYLHDVTVSGDGMYAYVSFLDNNLLQKIDTRADTVIGAANLTSAVAGVYGTGGWSIINLSPQDTALMVSGFLATGYEVTINTNSLLINNNLSADAHTAGTSEFAYPHGIASNATFDTFFATLEYGNVINKFSFAPEFTYKYISLDGNPPIAAKSATSPDPHQIQMSPDYSKYFVSCQNSNEVRVMDAYKDTLIKAIPVGAFPQEMAISRSKGYLFVVCMQDSNAHTPSGAKGCVTIIDYNTLHVVTTLYGDFYQPHDVCVDEQDGLIYICSTNSNPSGPPPHHVLGNCSGRDGWYTVYNLNTLVMYNNRYGVPVFPYAISNRF